MPHHRSSGIDCLGIGWVVHIIKVAGFQVTPELLQPPYLRPFERRVCESPLTRFHRKITELFRKGNALHRPGRAAILRPGTYRVLPLPSFLRLSHYHKSAKPFYDRLGSREIRLIRKCRGSYHRSSVPHPEASENSSSHHNTPYDRWCPNSFPSHD